MIQPPSEHPGPFFVMTFIMLAFYADLAWFREQFCAFLCPYARFQSVMMDQDTPTVSYDANRGEPRGAVKKKAESASSQGDCIDCQLCVRVCPTGIDIRNGLQLECIRCARCIDACNMVMTNLQRPPHLIKIASHNELAGEARIPFYRRPKALAYAVALTLLIAVGGIRIFARDSVALNITRAPGPAYTQMPDGRLGNTFLIRFTNNTASDVKLDLEILSPQGAQILCAQCQSNVKASEEQRVSAIIAFDPKNANQKLIIRNKSSDTTGESMLLGPR
jgi:cytochrome c oxidase accessory protein FixG